MYMHVISIVITSCFYVYVRHKYSYNVMFLCNCCSTFECNSNEEGRNGRNVWNLCYSFNLEIIRDYIYI